jgi:tetratricopeptide (TPR) repeat protein
LEGYNNLGRSQDALTAYTQALDLSNELVRQDPSSRDTREVQFLTQLSVASADHSLGHAAAAEKGYRNAISVQERIVADGPGSPSNYQNLATAYFALANQLRDNGNRQASLAYMQRARDLVQQVSAADPKEALFQRSLAMKELGLCNLIRLIGDPVQALPHCRDGLATLQKLSAADPQSGDKRSTVANALYEMGAAQLAAGDASAALALERQALAILHGMPEQAQDEKLRLYVLRASVTAGEAELALHQKQAAITEFQTAVSVAEKLVQDDPDQAYNHLDRTRAKTHLAQALAAAGQCSQAGPLFQQAIEEWKYLRELGILPPSEVGQAEILLAALPKCHW